MTKLNYPISALGKAGAGIDKNYKDFNKKTKMEYNAKLTKKPVTGKIKKMKHARIVVDFKGKLLCFYKGGVLYDLNEEVIAPCVKIKRREKENIKKIPGYCHDGDKVYFYGEETGQFVKKDPLIKILIYLSVLTAISFIATMLVICVPIKEPVKEIVITDKDGHWEANTDIDIFGGAVLKPGTNGEYLFTVNNPNSFEMEADINLTFFYGEGEKNLPILIYELKVNGVKTEFTRTEKGYSARNIKLNAKERSSFMLGWKWEFEAGQDDEDTVAGILGEEYGCTITIIAEEA